MCLLAAWSDQSHRKRQRNVNSWATSASARLLLKAATPSKAQVADPLATCFGLGFGDVLLLTLVKVG